MKNLLPKNSKRGVTLVECVIAVVLLGLLAVGVLNLLTAGGTKIARLSKEAADQAAATQKLDLAISAISNGSDDYIIKKTENEITTCYLDTAALEFILGFDDQSNANDDSIVELLAKCSLYSTETLQNTVDEDGNFNYFLLSDIRGWYLTLTYTGQSGKPVTVTGFASNSEGVFDKE